MRGKKTTVKAEDKLYYSSNLDNTQHIVVISAVTHPFSMLIFLLKHR